MLFLSRLFVICLPLFLLSACNENNSDDLNAYLMRHPYELRTKMVECKLIDNQQELLESRCDIVMKAGNDMMALIELQQKDPEQFGLNILRSQMSLATAQDILSRQMSEYERLKKSGASTATLNAAKQEIASGSQKVAQIKRDLDAKLAVVGLGSPE